MRKPTSLLSMFFTYLRVCLYSIFLISALKVNGQCTASFNSTATSVCAGNTVNFTSTSTGATGHSWKINEVPFSASTNSSYLFTSPGSFVIELVVSDGMGCQDSLSTTISVNQTPVVNVNISTTSLYLSDSLYINFTATGLDPGALFFWDFCDGNTAGNTAPFYYQWSAPGNTLCVCIEVENTSGCSDADCEIGITVTDDLGLPAPGESGFSVYPNPANEYLVIDLGPLTEPVSIFLFDYTGQQVSRYDAIYGPQFLLNIGHLAEGSYAIRISQNGVDTVLPLIIR